MALLVITSVTRPVSRGKTEMKKTTLLACIFTALLTIAPVVRANTPTATLSVRLPKTPVSAKSITVIAVAVETGQVLASLTAASANGQVSLIVSLVPQMVFADWWLPGGNRMSVHSPLLRPAAGRMLLVDLSLQSTAGIFPATVNGAYWLPAIFASFAMGGKPTLIGIPASGFTVRGLDVTGADVAGLVLSLMTNSANCYGEDGGFVVIETDPKVLAVIRAEIELSNSPLADPAYRMTNRYVAPRLSVGGSWSSDGTNITVTLWELDSQGKELLKRTATGPLDQLFEINDDVARALAEAMSPCPSASRWSGTVTYSRTTNDHRESHPNVLETATNDDSSSYQVKITISGGNSTTSGSAVLQSIAIVTTASHRATVTHIVDPQGCSISGPPVLKLDLTSSKDLSGSATQQLRGALSIKEDGTYTLRFDQPYGVVAQGANTYISSSTGWCDPEKEKKNNFSRNDPITESVMCYDSSIKISGRVDPSRPDTLKGTWTPEKEAPKAKTIITWDIQRSVSTERKAAPRRPR